MAQNKQTIYEVEWSDLFCATMLLDVTTTTTTTTVLWPFVWDYPGDPVPEETSTHSHLS